KVSAGRLVARPMKASLQDWAKACWRVREAAASPSKLWKVWPPTVMVGGQLAGLEGLRPRSSRSAVVTILKVDPGGYWPVSARLTAWSPGWVTAARRLPLEACIATSAAGWVTPLRACSADCWTLGSMLVWTGVPGVPAPLAQG